MAGCLAQASGRSCCGFQQLTGVHSERHRQLLHDDNRRVSGTALDVADIGSMDPRLPGQSFLTETEFEAKPSNIPAEASAYIHAPA